MKHYIVKLNNTGYYCGDGNHPVLFTNLEAAEHIWNRLVVDNPDATIVQIKPKEVKN